MKRKNVVFIFFIMALIIGFSQFPCFLNAGTQESGQVGAKARILPQVLSPEETLKVYLNAFISRDIQTAMAYLPREMYEKNAKKFCKTYMTERKHVIAIESIKLIGIETLNSVEHAVMEATIVTTPNFSGAVTCDGQGKCTVTHKWSFIQDEQDGSWVYDGGGF